ncbi:MAG: type IV pilus assembly protein PilM [Phycisphaerales bacterium]
MAQSSCWGVEVGAGAVKAVKLARDGEGVTVVDFAVVPHKRPLSSPEIDEKDAKRVALGTLISQHELTKSSVAISVPGHTAFARFAKLPPVEPKKIPDIVKFEAVQQIPFPIEEVEWDYQTFAAPDSPDVEVGIFAMTGEKVREKLAKWKDLGITPDTLTLSPLAAYNALSYDMQFTESTPGTVILDVGTTSTDLIVAESGRLWIRTFPIGGHNFTEALVSAFNLSYNKAEKLKREAESTQHTRHILQALRPVFGDLAQDVQRSIGYYNSLHRDAKLTRLVGLGETFNLPGLRKFLSQQLQIEVSRLEAFERVKHKNEERNTEFQKHAMGMATAVGCALQGLGYETIGANLMPVSVTREAVWAKKNKWFLAAAGLGLAAGAVGFLRPLMDKAAVAGVSRDPVIDQVKSEASQLKAKWGEVEAAWKPDANAATAMSLVEKRGAYAHLLEDFGQMMQYATAESPKFGGPAAKVQFRSLATRYAQSAGSRGETEGGGGEGDPAAGGPPPSPRVQMRLEIATARPVADAERFVNDTFQKWLMENADRPGTMFVVDKESIRWQRTGEAVISATGEAALQPAALPAAGRGAPAGRRGGGDAGGRRGGGDAGGGAEGGGSARGGGGGGPAASGGGADDMERFAPVPAAEQLGPPGATVYAFVIQWDALLRPDAPAVEQPKEGGT